MTILGYDIARCIRGRNKIRSIGGGQIEIHQSANLQNVRAYVHDGAILHIGAHCSLKNAVISVEKGAVILEDSVIINNSVLTISDGNLEVGHHSKLQCKRVWVRFGGKASIGSYTNINDGSEIRCDESVQIGSYCQISYNVRIWDTNTHNIIPKDLRRRIAEEYWPYFGFEETRPKTSPVSIGDDCWIGEGAAILKGTEIGSECIVGYGTIVPKTIIPTKSRVVTDCHLSINSICDSR